jgi:hypothetical protein
MGQERLICDTRAMSAFTPESNRIAARNASNVKRELARLTSI